MAASFTGGSGVKQASAAIAISETVHNTLKKLDSQPLYKYAHLSLNAFDVVFNRAVRQSARAIGGKPAHFAGSGRALGRYC
jgi:hypothetical protein